MNQSLLVILLVLLKWNSLARDRIERRRETAGKQERAQDAISKSKFGNVPVGGEICSYRSIAEKTGLAL
ncbi:MAG: hypothetical protein AB8B16_06375 [Prochlorococcus sp.]